MSGIQGITVQEVIDALKKNGLPWGKGAYYRDNSKNTYYAYHKVHQIAESCAIGQAAYNLKVCATELVSLLDAIPANASLGSSIVDKNDAEQTASYDEVVEYAETLLTPHKNYILSLFVFDGE